MKAPIWKKRIRKVKGHRQTQKQEALMANPERKDKTDNGERAITGRPLKRK